jgi:hypothetical protein
VGFVATEAQELSQVHLAGVQVIRKAGVSQPYNPVGVREASSPQGCPRWAALRRAAEAVLEAGPARGKSVDIRGKDIGRTITAQVLAQVMADDDDDIQMLFHGVSGYFNHNRFFGPPLPGIR